MAALRESGRGRSLLSRTNQRVTIVVKSPIALIDGVVSAKSRTPSKKGLGPTPT